MNKENNNLNDNDTNDDIINKILDEKNINAENDCIICWESEGKIILCSKCKFKYCDLCVKKIGSKCCICYRIGIKKNDRIDYFFEYNYEPLYENQHFFTFCLSLIIGIFRFIVLCLGFSFLIIYIVKISGII